MTVLAGSRLIFVRAMGQSLRSPLWVIMGILQPLLYMSLFGPLLVPIVQATPGFPPGDAWQVLVPALLIQQALFGTLFAGFNLISEHRAGVIERMRVTPLSRASLLLGRSMKDTTVLLVQAALLVVLGLMFGLRASPLGVLLTLVLVAVIGLAVSSLSYALALRLKDEGIFAPILNSLSLPVLLLSGILLPMTLAPAWLFAVSRINPFVYVVDAARALLRGDVASSGVLVGFLVATALAAVTVSWGVRTFRRESA